jgi:hypothetical protein
MSATQVVVRATTNPVPLTVGQLYSHGSYSFSHTPFPVGLATNAWASSEHGGWIPRARIQDRGVEIVLPFTTWPWLSCGIISAALHWLKSGQPRQRSEELLLLRGGSQKKLWP